jgi:hypothetical protein
VWVDSGGVYSGFKNASISSLYSGINRESGGSDYIAHIGSSQAFVMDIPSDVNSTYYKVKKFLYSFSRPEISGPYINTSVITTTSSGSSSNTISDLHSAEIIEADFLYLSLWGEAGYNYTFVVYSVTRYSLIAYYCQIRILKQTGQIQQSVYFLKEVSYDDLPYIKDIVNNFCYKNYYVPLVNYGENQDDNTVYVVTGIDCLRVSNYQVVYTIDYQDAGGYWNRTRIELTGNTRVSSGAVKRFLFTQSSHELSVLVYGKKSEVEGKCHAAVMSYKGSLWNGINNVSSQNLWSIYDNFPAAFTDKMGNNMWVSNNLKWMFAVLYGTTEKPYGKGLITVKSSTPIIGKTGWSSTSYYIDDDSTLEIRNAVANKYVLDIIFNKADYKMIILCNSLIGSGYEQNPYLSFISPDYLYCFIYNGKKWMEFSKESVGMSTLWNRYNNYKIVPGSGTEVYFKPYFSVTGNTGIYDSNRKISFVYPAEYSTYKPTAYEFGLTFGD